MYSNDHSIAKTEGAWISTFLVSTCGSVVGDYDDYIIANYATTPVHELAATVCQRAPGTDEVDDDDWRDDDDDDGWRRHKGLGVCPVGLDMSKANTHDDGWRWRRPSGRWRRRAGRRRRCWTGSRNALG